MSRQFTRIFQFSFLMLGITAVLVFSVHAAPPTQETVTSRPRFNLEEIPYQAVEADTGAPAESALAVTAPDALLPWSKVTFQSLRNGNWDIFVGNDDGSGQTAVVASGASEIHPHLNRGNTKIVYASNSGGDHEIYVANVDGSGQTALTNNSTDDGNPTWSPDGSKIAFEAYRNGEANIYVMNANGTGQTRLTTSADFDGMPTWSPDGSKIAFVSRRTGGYRIYVMNADGSGQTQLSNQPYSLRPQWSPDGTQIAYDADNDADGWQDLWRMNADGSSQAMVYNPGGQTDAWASSWSPDGKRIVYTLISFINYQGNWYWTYAYPDTWGSGLGTTRLSSNGLDWDASWQTSDNLPPSASFAYQSQFQSGSPKLNWSGTDNGDSGLAAFDVHYRNVNSTNWIVWQDNTLLTESTFTGQAGETYIFRVRAKDSAYNFSKWQLAPTSITLYSWSISGNIMDNVGNPIQNASIFTNPGSFFGESSLANGQYATYAAQTNGTYDVQWSKAGYGNLPLTTFSELPTENILDIMLPPANNVVQDSSFESNNIALDAVWETAGTYTEPSLTIYSHTGSYGARMGYNKIGGPSYYTPNEHLFYEDDFDSSPMLALSPTQQIHVIWQNYETGDIYYAKQISNDTWSNPERLSEIGASDTGLEQILIDSNGDIHTVWRENGEMLYAFQANGEAWSVPVNLSVSAPGDRVTDASLISYENKVSLIFNKHLYSPETYSIYAISRDLSGSWSSYETITTGLEFGQFSADSDNNGYIHVTVGPSYNWPFAYYWQKSPVGLWSQTQSIPIDAGVNRSDMVVADNGVVHFLSWAHNYALYHTKRSISGNWSSPYIITNQSTQNYAPKAIITEANSLHVVWTVNPLGGDSWGLYYANRSNNGVWTSPTRITAFDGMNQSETARFFINGAFDSSYLIYTVQDGATLKYYFCLISPDSEWYEPSRVYTNEYKIGDVLFAEDGVLHSILYQNNGSGIGMYHDIFEFRDNEYSSLSQVVNITEAIQNPYMSFMYKMSGGNSDIEAGLQLIIDNGVTQTVAAELYESKPNWNLAFVDLSQCSGQTVTATWQVNQVSGTLPVYLNLDDISIGSAYPDLWLEISGPPTALVDDQITYTLFYGNQSPVAVSDSEISITLPETLHFVSADPLPTSTSPSLNWKISELVDESGTYSITLTLQLGATAPKLTTIQFEANIETASNELEILNNRPITSLFVGKFIYLPITQK